MCKAQRSKDNRATQISITQLGTGTDQQGADAWPWLDEDEVSNSGYSGQRPLGGFTNSK